MTLKLILCGLRFMIYYSCQKIFVWPQRETPNRDFWKHFEEAFRRLSGSSQRALRRLSAQESLRKLSGSSQDTLRKLSASSQETLNSGISQKALRKLSGDSQEALSKLSGDSQLRNLSGSSQEALRRLSGDPLRPSTPPRHENSSEHNLLMPLRSGMQKFPLFFNFTRGFWG